MADANPEISASPHRGRIQAQGGDTEESEAWAQYDAPTESEMMEKVDLLEGKLTHREKKDRVEPFAKLRRCIQQAADRGGVDAPFFKTWGKRNAREIRIDFEVRLGRACVPDRSE
jgi:hypothetical protein